MKKALTTFILLTFLHFVRAQDGEIAGKITDQHDEGVSKATIDVISSSGTLIKVVGNTTDLDGNFSLKPLKPGSYSLEVKHPNCQSKRIEQIIVTTERMTFINILLEEHPSPKTQNKKKLKH